MLTFCRSIEKALEHLRTSKKNVVVPEEFPYAQAREMFMHPEVLSKDDIPAMKWKKVRTVNPIPPSDTTGDLLKPSCTSFRHLCLSSIRISER